MLDTYNGQYWGCFGPENCRPGQYSELERGESLEGGVGDGRPLQDQLLAAGPVACCMVGPMDDKSQITHITLLCFESDSLVLYCDFVFYY